MAEDSGFSFSGLFGDINDSFKSLADTYLKVEGIKAQTGALKAQAEYQALTQYNPSYTSNPNAYPLTPQQLAALQAQQNSMGGVSPAMLILGGVLLVGAVLVLK